MKQAKPIFLTLSLFFYPSPSPYPFAVPARALLLEVERETVKSKSLDRWRNRTSYSNTCLLMKVTRLKWPKHERRNPSLGNVESGGGRRLATVSHSVSCCLVDFALLLLLLFWAISSCGHMVVICCCLCLVVSFSLFKQWLMWSSHDAEVKRHRSDRPSKTVFESSLVVSVLFSASVLFLPLSEI